MRIATTLMGATMGLAIGFLPGNEKNKVRGKYVIRGFVIIVSYYIM